MLDFLYNKVFVIVGCSQAAKDSAARVQCGGQWDGPLSGVLKRDKSGHVCCFCSHEVVKGGGADLSRPKMAFWRPARLEGTPNFAAVMHSWNECLG